MNQSNQRFVVVGATSLLDLVGALNTVMPLVGRLVYFGPNIGAYTDISRYSDAVRTATCIAVYDNAPAIVFPVDDVDIFNDDAENDTSVDVSPKMETTMSA